MMSPAAELFDDRLCDLGEGPLWHPDRGSLLWFDINAGALHEREAGEGGASRTWRFDGPASAAAIVDARTLLVATHAALLRLDLETGETTAVAPLEAENEATRSNDGRADPRGGFWIGTMGRGLERDAGAIYRFRFGETRRLHAPITIPNAICFSPDGARAYFTDTPRAAILTQALDEDGWPVGPVETFADLSEGPGKPDGAVCDAEGFVWSARWGGSRVVRHRPDGRVDHEVMVPASQVTCPAFGGPDHRNLYVTTAREGLDAEALAREPMAGATFLVARGVPGRPEPRIVLR